MGLVLSAVADLRRAARKFRPALGDGTSTLIGVHIVSGVVQLGRNLVLSRLLVPEAYGAFGVIMSIFTILQFSSDLGVRSFVTRHATADDKVLQTVWSVRLIRSILLAGLMFLGAEPFAALYSSPELASGVRAGAGLFLAEGVASIAPMLGERNRRVIRLSLYDFARMLFITVVSIIAAVHVRSYWAIIIGMFAGAAFQIYASYRLFPRLATRLRFDRRCVIELLRFSAIIAPSSIIGIVLLQADKFFMANFFPLAELGKYVLAAAVAAAANGLTQQYVLRVFFPLMAQVIRETPDRAAQVYYGSRRRLTLVLAFGIGGVIGGGELVTQILFNDNYAGAGFYLSVLSLASIATLMIAPAEQTLIAKGFTRAVLVTNATRVAWIATAGPIAFFQFGPLAVIVAISLASYPALPFCWWRLNRYGLFKAREEFYVVAVAAVGAAIGHGVQSAAAWLVAAGYLPSF